MKRKSFWIVKTFGLLFRLILAGGLIALLFYSKLGVRAVVYFDGENYQLKTEKIFFSEEKKEVIEDVYFEDFDGDGRNEKVILKDGAVTFFYNDLVIFESDAEWDVREVLIGDFNNDGNLDLGLYLWKIGNYGDAKPFWEEENDDSYKQHLFLYEWDFDEARLKSLWHSSNLPYINVKTVLTDINGDDENELIVLERPYEWGEDGAAGETVAVWKWDEWGFTNIWRSEEGKYVDIETN